jgi:hypothetical protein
MKAILIFSFVLIFTEVASAGNFGIGLFFFTMNNAKHIAAFGRVGKISSRDQRYDGAWYWYKARADIEQLQKDYAECREDEYEWICMVHKKGYDWWPSGPGYWHKEGGTIEQLQYDYGKCKGRDTPCMEKIGYTWVQKCWN